MKNPGLDETQAWIYWWKKCQHPYTDDILMAESEEELKSLLMKVKEESEESWLKAQESEN